MTAVDSAPEAVEMTRRTAQEAGVDVEILVGDIHDLDLGRTFDVVHAHQVLQHVADPVQALTRMRALTTPGGLVAAADTDYSGWTWFPLVPQLDDWMDLYQRVARSNGGEPDAGRRLLSWARAAGLQDVRYTVHTWTYADPSTRAWWSGVWQRRILESDFATQALRDRQATRSDLEDIADGWRRWGEAPDATITIPHGAILARA